LCRTERIVVDLIVIRDTPVKISKSAIALTVTQRV